MPGFYSATLLDYDAESDNMRFEVPILTAANWAAQATKRGDFETALMNVVVGTRKSSRYGNRSILSSNPASDPGAQRELKMLVQYHDAVTYEVLKPVEFPCPDPANLDPDDRAHFNLGDGDVIDDFKDAFEAYVKSPALNAVVIDELTLVGRRL